MDWLKEEQKKRKKERKRERKNEIGREMMDRNSAISSRQTGPAPELLHMPWFSRRMLTFHNDVTLFPAYFTPGFASRNPLSLSLSFSLSGSLVHSLSRSD